jgi:hypothetical protein
MESNSSRNYYCGCGSHFRNSLGSSWNCCGIVYIQSVSYCRSSHIRSKKITHNKIYISAFRMLRVFLNVVLICVTSFIIKINVSGYFEWVCWSVAFVIYAVLVVTVMTVIFDRKEFVSLIQRFKKILLRK